MTKLNWTTYATIVMANFQAREKSKRLDEHVKTCGDCCEAEHGYCREACRMIAEIVENN